MNYYSYELARMRYEEVGPLNFYRDLFGDGNLATSHDNPEDYEVGKYSAIAVCITDKTKSNGQRLVKRYHITDEFDNLDLLMNSEDFCFMAPISYAGKSRTSTNARHMYALCIEIDDLIVKYKEVPSCYKDDYDVKYNQNKGVYERCEYVGLHNLFKYFDNSYPTPSYIVASGTGVHLYYIFEQPIALFENIAKTIATYKRALTKKLWNKKVTNSYEEKNIQFESIFQAFRVPGTYTKAGIKTKNKRDDKATVHRVSGEKVTIDYMNFFVAKRYKMDVLYKSSLTLAEAKEKYPEWYERRIVRGEKKGRWVCDEDVYNWWLNRIKNETKVGHRYYCMMILVIYAIKCDIPEEKVEKDCYDLLDLFEEMTTNEDNHFTEKDVIDALQVYQDFGYVTYPINSIVNRSGLQIEKNKRNGRKKSAHVEYMNEIRKFKIRQNECSAGGRPKGSDKSEIVRNWQLNNPKGTKAACIRETGLSKNTVYKWWNDEVKEAIIETEITF